MGQFRCCATFQRVLRYFKINLESPNNRPPLRRNQPKWSDHSALKNRKQINKQQYNERRLTLSCWHIVSPFSECAYIEIIFGLGLEWRNNFKQFHYKWCLTEVLFGDSKILELMASHLWTVLFMYQMFFYGICALHITIVVSIKKFQYK